MVKNCYCTCCNDSVNVWIITGAFLWKNHSLNVVLTVENWSRGSNFEYRMCLSVFYITELCMNVNSKQGWQPYCTAICAQPTVTALSCNGVHDEQCILYACSVMRSCLPLLLIQSLCFKNSHVFTQPHRPTFSISTVQLILQRLIYTRELLILSKHIFNEESIACQIGRMGASHFNGLMHSNNI